MRSAPMFLEDETLTDNLTDEISIRLLKMGEAIWCLYPDCVTSFVKVIRLVNNLAGADSETMRKGIWENVYTLTGIGPSDLDINVEAQIDVFVARLEELYAPKQ